MNSFFGQRPSPWIRRALLLFALVGGSVMAAPTALVLRAGWQANDVVQYRLHKTRQQAGREPVVASFVAQMEIKERNDQGSLVELVVTDPDAGVDKPATWRESGSGIDVLLLLCKLPLMIRTDENGDIGELANWELVSQTVQAGLQAQLRLEKSAVKAQATKAILAQYQTEAGTRGQALRDLLQLFFPYGSELVPGKGKREVGEFALPTIGPLKFTDTSLLRLDHPAKGQRSFEYERMFNERDFSDLMGKLLTGMDKAVAEATKKQWASRVLVNERATHVMNAKTGLVQTVEVRRVLGAADEPMAVDTFRASLERP